MGSDGKASWLLATAAAILLLACGPSPNPGDDDDTDPCAAVDFCSGHGTCAVTDGTGICTCEVGWDGVKCDRCDADYEPDGAGGCRPKDPCQTLCVPQHRDCNGTDPDNPCGDCLDGYYEEAGNCIEICAASSNPGQLVPLDLYVMLDRSSSMDDGSRWPSVVAAITEFVQSSDVAGIGMGIQYFPQDPSGTIPTSCTDCGLYGPCVPGWNVCSGSFAPDTSCDPVDYDSADVPIAELPGVRPAIEASIAGTSPQGSSTPTQPAYSGAVIYATTWAEAHPDHLTFIVFATDGEPNNCTYNSIQGTADLAAGAASATPSVKTYVIGVGTELAALNEIAAAGGTGAAMLVDTGGDVTQQFIQALNEIRESQTCKYQIPEPTTGTFDPNMVNVAVGDPPSRVYYVGSAASCDPTTGGWYYDNPTSPTMIELCPATCELVKVGALQVDVQVGCQTIVR